METLEQTIERINRLKEGLNARIIVQPGEFETLEVYPPHWSRDRDGDVVPVIATEYKEIIPEICEPNVSKRENSRQQLQQLYDSCPWYSGRYMAARALEVNSEKLNQDMDQWLKGLEKNLLATKTEHVPAEAGLEMSFSEISSYYRHTAGGTSADWRCIPEPEMSYGGHDAYDGEIPDVNKRLDAIVDAVKLFEYSGGDSTVFRLIKKAYASNPEKYVREIAGKELGYSKFRRWFHELRGNK